MTQVRRATAQTNKLRAGRSRPSRASRPRPAYPNNSFASKLAGLAEMLGRGMPLRLRDASRRRAATTPTPTRRTRSATNLGRTCDAVLAFQRDLEERGEDDHVLTEMWSEFGRRPDENGSAGTDHGAGGLRLRRSGAGLRARWSVSSPASRRLDEDDNLIWTSDFRAMYAALIDQWLEEDPDGDHPGVQRARRHPDLVKP